MKLCFQNLVLLASLTPFICGVTFSLALSIDSQYPEVPSSDIDLPGCYIQTTNSRVFNLDSLCRKKLENSVPSMPSRVPSSAPTAAPYPASTGVPYPVPTGAAYPAPTATPYPVPSGTPYPSPVP